MKLKIAIILLLIGFLNSTFAQPIARVENIKIQSKFLNQERELLIYTPKDYDWRTNEYFNVIYVFDSQDREFFDYCSAIVSFLSNASKAFIIVGITSPYNEKLDYSRRNDFLPNIESDDYKKQAGTYYGNADPFLSYVASEVVEYVNKNYRTLNQNFAVGHSLGGSFVLYTLLKKPNLFQNYIAVSPNLAYDDNKLSKELLNFDYNKIKNPTFIYLSHANEGIEYWNDWKPARETVYSFFKNSLNSKNIQVEIGEFPNNNHWNTFPPSLNNALEFYFKNSLQKQESALSEQKYEVTIRLKVNAKEDVVYIAGNQPNLGDWNPNKIQMKKISDLEREIVVKVQSPARFKFTKGSWDTEFQVVGTYTDVIIKPELNKKFKFEIVKDE